MSPYVAPGAITRVAVVGAGAIGAAWATLATARGLDVAVADPAPDAEERLRSTVDRQREQLPPRETGGRTGDLTLVRDVAEAVRDADLVIEAGPERLDVKREIFAAADAAARPDVLLTSSSSGLTPSSFQDACTHHPERVLVAHPFNPPHLVPLIEIVGGSRTDAAAVDAAMATFAHLGKHPIRINAELPGHVTNRLQAALWREAYDLVARGVVTVADVDTAIASGPGLRWALYGPFATQHLSGGPGGIGHVLEHLGPPMLDWWADLGQPELTPELCRTIAAQTDDAMAGQDLDEVTRRRDEALQALLALKAASGIDAPADTHPAAGPAAGSAAGPGPGSAAGQGGSHA
ncbi:3-hydroxyacyl-CoA dehydrogenase NAD-binding domain-containing protein [Arsenicicoccus bolidensis]|uniref:3-hydroxyacyl-CoA dehydrogenase NAD-binding domain-containing protein n=1 Tax=Arsenicicoccus bolidensis TaxID=229480 RepID=A0ABS9Q200_9MICO|nr:3-hydroxyacyl-CoA dehydrogenase NAD-binding domain-containing protein [Arsenicicoccus bolidensis]MCG7321118.1 3-hydroxyacyl-CoA dehydrogenase NAD-binding domain-containing protein [Arsenicicoccus bolidensis]